MTATSSQDETPIYENYPIRGPHPPSTRSKNQLERGSSNTTNKPLGAKSDPLGSKPGPITSPKPLQRTESGTTGEYYNIMHSMYS